MQPARARPLGQRLASFAVDLGHCDLPAPVLAEARRVFVNNFCVTFAGAEEPSLRSISETLTALRPKKEARPIGSLLTLDIAGAVLLNAAAGNVEDFDDTHLPTVMHLGAVIYAPVLALAQTHTITGRAALTAYAAGAEIAVRLGLGLGMTHYRRGWHITTTCATVGAAVASGLCLGLDRRWLSEAIGIAAQGASGLIANLHTGAKSVGIGNAARNGLLAALLARAGTTAHPEALEGAAGMLAVMGADGDPDAITVGLGTSWRLLDTTCKPYATGTVNFPVFDAAIALHPQIPDPAAVTAITITGHPLLLQRADRRTPRTPREAKLSAQHSAAMGLLRGKGGIAEHTSAAIADTAGMRLRRLARLVADASIPIEACRLEIARNSAPTVSIAIANCRGSLAKPLSDEEITEKCRDVLAEQGEFDGGALVRSLWDLASIDDIARLIPPGDHRSSRASPQSLVGVPLQ